MISKRKTPKTPKWPKMTNFDPAWPPGTPAGQFPKITSLVSRTTRHRKIHLLGGPPPPRGTGAGGGGAGGTRNSPKFVMENQVTGPILGRKRPKMVVFGGFFQKIAKNRKKSQKLGKISSKSTYFMGKMHHKRRWSNMGYWTCIGEKHNATRPNQYDDRTPTYKKWSTDVSYT